jgi:hypothetical protein
LATTGTGLFSSIKDGVPGSLVKDDLIRVSARQQELETLLATTEEPPPVLIHPSMAERYKQEVAALSEALADENYRSEAAELLRSLVEKVALTPVPGQKRLSIDLYGDLAGILSIATKQTSLP